MCSRNSQEARVDGNTVKEEKVIGDEISEIREVRLCENLPISVNKHFGFYSEWYERTWRF